MAAIMYLSNWRSFWSALPLDARPELIAIVPISLCGRTVVRVYHSLPFFLAPPTSSFVVVIKVVTFSATTHRCTLVVRVLFVHSRVKTFWTFPWLSPGFFSTANPTSGIISNQHAINKSAWSIVHGSLAGLRHDWWMHNNWKTDLPRFRCLIFPWQSNNSCRQGRYWSRCCCWWFFGVKRRQDFIYFFEFFGPRLCSSNAILDSFIFQPLFQMHPEVDGQFWKYIESIDMVAPPYG